MVQIDFLKDDPARYTDDAHNASIIGFFRRLVASTLLHELNFY